MIFGLDAWIIWLILMVAFLVIESLTFNMTTIWFAAGCLAAIILDLFQAEVLWQVIVMLAVSILLLVLYIMIIKPRTGSPGNPAVPTNADRLIGAEGLVIEPIDPVNGTGQVKVSGQIWSAVSENNQKLDKDTSVMVLEIRGVKVVVRPRQAG